MDFDFDKIIERKGSSCIKWDGIGKFLGSGDVLPMWVADMDFQTPLFITEAIIARANHGVFGYPLREEGYYTSLIAWLHRRHQWKVEREWISFCPGVVPAVNMAVLAYTLPGDKIIVQPPVYFPFFTAVTDHNRTLVYNQLVMQNGRLCMDFDNLEVLAKDGAKMLILSNPHNPGGSVWTKEELLQMADICLRYNVLIISDEIHCDLIYKPFKHTPVAGLSQQISMQTITTVAPSKTFNLSGFSTSSVIIENDSLHRKFNSQLDHLHIGGGNIFGNIASEEAYTHGDNYVDELMEYLAGNIETLETFVSENLPKIKVIRPESTFLVWLDCRGMEMNETDLNEFFLHKAKVGFNPGIMFGPGGEGFMRMNIGCPKATLLQGLNQIKDAFTDL
ncbi:MAG: PatB family C-S lyase [Lentimicrobiaceae bacterium]|jgi:cystathionine beta-lyase